MRSSSHVAIFLSVVLLFSSALLISPAKASSIFDHDAPGVILACELMDLESRGYELNFDTHMFFEMVKSNSQPSTLEWLEKHPPNEDDWLALLNFNYR